MPMTQKQKLADYDRLASHAELLELYLYDTQLGRKPDAVETYKDTHCGKVRVELWRASSAFGGYVVITEASPRIDTLDAAIQSYEGNHSDYSLGIRICLERLRVIRNRIISAPDAVNNCQVSGTTWKRI